MDAPFHNLSALVVNTEVIPELEEDHHLLVEANATAESKRQTVLLDLQDPQASQVFPATMVKPAKLVTKDWPELKSTHNKNKKDASNALLEPLDLLVLMALQAMLAHLGKTAIQAAPEKEANKALQDLPETKDQAETTELQVHPANPDKMLNAPPHFPDQKALQDLPDLLATQEKQARNRQLDNQDLPARQDLLELPVQMEKTATPARLAKPEVLEATLRIVHVPRELAMLQQTKPLPRASKADTLCVTLKPPKCGLFSKENLFKFVSTLLVFDLCCRRRWKRME
jgi:hypothetical protein